MALRPGGTAYRSVIDGLAVIHPELGFSSSVSHLFDADFCSSSGAATYTSVTSPLMRIG